MQKGCFQVEEFRWQKARLRQVLRAWQERQPTEQLELEQKKQQETGLWLRLFQELWQPGFPPPEPVRPVLILQRPVWELQPFAQPAEKHRAVSWQPVG